MTQEEVRSLGIQLGLTYVDGLKDAPRHEASDPDFFLDVEKHQEMTEKDRAYLRLIAGVLLRTGAAFDLRGIKLDDGYFVVDKARVGAAIRFSHFERLAGGVNFRFTDGGLKEVLIGHAKDYRE